MVGFFFLCAGTPGTRSLTPKFLKRNRKTIHAKAGVLAPVLVGLIEANFQYRVPISKHFLKVQSVFRIAQNWGLYGAGPKRMRRLQISIDGEPVYLTNDPALRWRAPQLTHRKIRPLPDTMTIKAEAFNWTGFSRWVLNEARADFPEATEVSVVAIFRDHAVNAERRIHHGRRARAPDWSWEHLGPGGVRVEAPEVEADEP